MNLCADPFQHTTTQRTRHSCPQPPCNDCGPLIFCCLSKGTLFLYERVRAYAYFPPTSSFGFSQTTTTTTTTATSLMTFCFPLNLAPLWFQADQFALIERHPTPDNPTPTNQPRSPRPPESFLTLASSLRPTFFSVAALLSHGSSAICQ